MTSQPLNPVICLASRSRHFDILYTRAANAIVMTSDRLSYIRCSHCACVESRGLNHIFDILLCWLIRTTFIAPRWLLYAAFLYPHKKPCLRDWEC